MFINIVSMFGSEVMLNYEKHRGFAYCQRQDYELLAIEETIGFSECWWLKAWGNVVDLAKNGMIDIVVLPRRSALPVNDHLMGTPDFSGK